MKFLVFTNEEMSQSPEWQNQSRQMNASKSLFLKVNFFIHICFNITIQNQSKIINKKDLDITLQKKDFTEK